MIRTVRNDFTLPSYEIVSPQVAAFEGYVDFKKGEKIEVKQQKVSFGTIIDITSGDKIASFWGEDIPEWYPVMKSNTKPVI